MNSTSPALTSATPIQRFVAFLIDLVILSLPIWAIGQFHLDKSLSALLGTLLTAAYFILLDQSPLQATIGKRVLGLRLVSTSGSVNITLDQSSLRYIILFCGVPSFHLLGRIERHLWRCCR